LVRQVSGINPLQSQGIHVATGARGLGLVIRLHGPFFGWP
jgi:hypothetical protein